MTPTTMTALVISLTTGTKSMPDRRRASAHTFPVDAHGLLQNGSLVSGAANASNGTID